MGLGSNHSSARKGPPATPKPQCWRNLTPSFAARPPPDVETHKWPHKRRRSLASARGASALESGVVRAGGRRRNPPGGNLARPLECSTAERNDPPEHSSAPWRARTVPPECAPRRRPTHRAPSCAVLCQNSDQIRGKKCKKGALCATDRRAAHPRGSFCATDRRATHSAGSQTRRKVRRSPRFRWADWADDHKRGLSSVPGAPWALPKALLGHSQKHSLGTPKSTF